MAPHIYMVRSIIMAGLQGGEREYPFGHLVLGHDAETDRQHLLRLCVEQDHGGHRRAGKAKLWARPLSGTASGQPSSGSPLSDTASTSRP